MKYNIKNVLAGVGVLLIIVLILFVGILGNANGGLGGLVLQSTDTTPNQSVSPSPVLGEVKVLNTLQESNSTLSKCSYTGGNNELAIGTSPSDRYYYTGLAFNKNGDMYVLEPRFWKSFVMERTPGYQAGYNSPWNFSYPFRRTGFINPSGIAIDSKDNIYVADSGNNSIRMFDKTNKLLKIWYEKDLQKPYAPFSPSVMSTYKDSKDGKEYVVFVNTTNNASLFKFEANNVNATISYFSDYKGDIRGITADSGNVYISDHGTNKIVKFNFSGLKILEVGETGIGDGQFSSIYGVAVDDTYIYIADQGNHRVHIFTKNDLKYYSSFEGNYFDANGNDELKNPFALAIFSNGLYPILYISDAGDGHVRSFGVSYCARIITIKNFIPGFNPLDFRFTIKEGVPGPGGIYPNPKYRVAFNLVDAGNDPSSKKTLSVSADSIKYVVEELKDYKDINISYSCVYSVNNKVSKGSGGIVGIDPKFNETVTCTFTNKECPTGQLCGETNTKTPIIKKP